MRTSSARRLDQVLYWTAFLLILLGAVQFAYAIIADVGFRLGWFRGADLEAMGQSATLTVPAWQVSLLVLAFLFGFLSLYALWRGRIWALWATLISFLFGRADWVLIGLAAGDLDSWIGMIGFLQYAAVGAILLTLAGTGRLR